MRLPSIGRGKNPPGSSFFFLNCPSYVFQQIYLTYLKLSLSQVWQTPHHFCLLHPAQIMICRSYGFWCFVPSCPSVGVCGNTLSLSNILNILPFFFFFLCYLLYFQLSVLEGLKNHAANTTIFPESHQTLAFFHSHYVFALSLMNKGSYAPYFLWYVVYICINMQTMYPFFRLILLKGFCCYYKQCFYKYSLISLPAHTLETRQYSSKWFQFGEKQRKSEGVEY